MAEKARNRRCKLLGAAGADVHHTANNGATALSAATANKHPEVAALLKARIAELAEQARLAALAAQSASGAQAQAQGSKRKRG